VLLRSRLLASVTTALVGGLVVGLLALAPTAAGAADRRPDRHRQDPAETVFARSSYLCYGYQDCRDKGMSNAGYAQNSGTMYWRMYSGHNCTNYAAYRMVRSGLPNERPWSGGGNATYWGTSMPRVTDGTPRVGAVAWWKANTGPAGSAGHVAYVERVVSADQIVISQDSWAGDFSWAVVTRASGNWPSGFVHFNDLRLVNRAVPAISGIAKVGSVLSTTAGTWQPADADVTYQWSGDGVPIKDATQSTLRLTRAQLSERITVTASATLLGYPSQSVTSAATSAVQPGALRSVVAPALSGLAKVDSTLTLEPGEWTPAPNAFRYQWLANGVPIDGATSTTLDLAPDLVDQTITARVTASRAGYGDVTAPTAGSAPVAPGTITVHRQPAVTGTPLPGQILESDTGAYTPGDADVAVQWLRDGEPVLNATGPTYLVGPDDLGARISLQATVARTGYTTTTVTSPATAPVRVTPTLRVGREVLRHRVRLVVTLTAPDVDEVSGTVVVRVQGGFRQEVALRHGVARVIVQDLLKGRHALAVTFLGSPSVLRVTRTGSLRMP
jgi:surface antigen